jgi:rubrerythrin
MYQVGKQYKVYIEDQSGRVMEGPAVSARIDYQFEYSGIQRTHIEFEAIGEVTWTDRTDWKNSVDNRKRAPEWKCDHCGRPNKRANEICTSCGAPRSFIYDS